jgi:hypothetical protein
MYFSGFHALQEVTMNRCVQILIVISLIFSGCITEGTDYQTPGCKLSDIQIDAIIPKGYISLPTECPKVAYTKKLTSEHALGFYIINSPYPYNSSDTQTPLNALTTHVLVVKSTFDTQYRGQNYNTQRIDESADYPPALLENGGACAGLLAKLPISYQGRKGVEWRRGIMCLVEQLPKGSDKWVMIQAFHFDQNLERTDYEPTGDFEQTARKLFRSISMSSEK